MSKKIEATTKKRRSPKPRCLNGQRHRWIMGSALKASEGGTLGGERARSHLRGECRHCHKVRNFHPYAATSQRVMGVYAGKRRAA